MRKIGRSDLKNVYDKLLRHFGPQGWWPGDTRFEIIVGAILTQNTAWKNVEKAISNLKAAGALDSPSAMMKLGQRRIARLIRPAGYYNVKAKRLCNFLRFLRSRHDFSLDNLSRLKTPLLRQELLSVNGIGPETCDSILLYAFRRPIFVVDAYTKRIFSRHGLFETGSSYDHIQKIFMDSLLPDHILYNEYHALIVRLGKEHCRKCPNCAECPLSG
ncbi:MAG: endonuclease III domain-containing protein [Candidatus Omnitrophica bacterium]|nr:endonuclease III domain-containing protein [Candidatus Omnitrophota bacterium]